MKKLAIFFIIFLIVNINCLKEICKHNDQSFDDDKCKMVGKEIGKKLKEGIEGIIDKCNNNPDEDSCKQYCRQFIEKIENNINLNNKKKNDSTNTLIDQYFRNGESLKLKKMLIEFMKTLPARVVIKTDSEFYQIFEEILSKKNLRRLESFIDRSILCEFIMGLFGFDTDDCFD